MDVLDTTTTTTTKSEPLSPQTNAMRSRPRGQVMEKQEQPYDSKCGDSSIRGLPSVPRPLATTTTSSAILADHIGNDEDFIALARAITTTCLAIVLILLLPIWLAVLGTILGVFLIYRDWRPTMTLVVHYATGQSRRYSELSYET